MGRGRYRGISGRISSDIFAHWKKGVGQHKTVAHTCTYEFEGNEFDVEAYLTLTKGTGLRTDGYAGYSLDGSYEDYIRVEFEAGKEGLPVLWESISMNLKDIIRHEVEHLTHGNSDNLKPGKYLDEDDSARHLIKKKKLPRYMYYLLPKEIDANIQGLLFRAKKERSKLSEVVNSYLDSERISADEKKCILETWQKRLPSLGIKESLR